MQRVLGACFVGVHNNCESKHLAIRFFHISSVHNQIYGIVFLSVQWAAQRVFTISLYLQHPQIQICFVTSCRRGVQSSVTALLLFVGLFLSPFLFCTFSLSLCFVCACNRKQKTLPVEFNVEIEAGIIMKPFLSESPEDSLLYFSRFLFLLTCSSFTGSASSKFICALYIFSSL